MKTEAARSPMLWRIVCPVPVLPALPSVPSTPSTPPGLPAEKRAKMQSSGFTTLSPHFQLKFFHKFCWFFWGRGSRLKSEAKDSWEVSILGVVWEYGLESKVLHEREIQTQVLSLSSHIEVSTLENGKSFNLGDLDLNPNSDFSHLSPPQPLFWGKYQILGQKFLLKVQCFLSPVLCISLWRLAH